MNYMKNILLLFSLVYLNTSLYCTGYPLRRSQSLPNIPIQYVKVNISEINLRDLAPDWIWGIDDGKRLDSFSEYWEIRCVLLGLDALQKNIMESSQALRTAFSPGRELKGKDDSLNSTRDNRKKALRQAQDDRDKISLQTKLHQLAKVYAALVIPFH